MEDDLKKIKKMEDNVKKKQKNDLKNKIENEPINQNQPNWL